MLKLVLFKRIFVSILYVMTALTACLFALLLVSNFINPAISQEAVDIQKKEPSGFKEVLGDIVKNLKTILKDSMQKNKEFNENIGPEKPPPEETEDLEPSDMPSDRPPVDSAPSGSPSDSPPMDSAPSDSPSDTPPVDSTPSDSPSDRTPVDSMPSGSPSDRTPVDSMPSGSPSDRTPVDSMPSDSPSDRPPVDSASSDSPSDRTPVDSMPSDSPSESMPPTDQIPSEPIPEAVPTEAQSVGGSQTFMEDLSGVPSEWLLDIQSSVAPFIYEYGTQKDPFEDPTIQEEIKTEGVIVIPKTPPEEYDLKEIRLKGIIWHTQTPKALFELPSSAGYYTLIKGDKIGKNGVIFEIREDEVVVVETSYIGKGKDKKEEIKIKIKRMDRLNLFGSSKGF